VTKANAAPGHHIGWWLCPLKGKIMTARSTMMVLATALLAGSLLATGAQARGGHDGGGGLYQEQKTQFHVDYHGLYYLSDPMEQRCSTAPDFCPDYHGDNG
jgi:hypothetical protein